MVNLKNISCYDENDILWEGKILVQQNGNFEGIIDSDFINSYMYGNFDIINSSIHITKITPENYPYHIENYIAFQDDNCDRYFGETIDIEGDRHLCSVLVNDLNINKSLLESQIKDIEFIIEHHKKTMSERYNEYLQSIMERHDEEELNRAEVRSMKKGKLNYYL